MNVACHINYPKVSIIILNWNGLEDTIKCLESLKKITYPNYDIVVVDNASSGNDVEVLREKFGDYVYMIENDKNYGFAEGCNIGMRYALAKGTDYIFLLNNDTTVARDFLAELVKIAESDERIGILGPKIYLYDEPNVIWEAGAKINWWTGGISIYGDREVDIGQYDKVAERDLLSGAALLIKARVLERISLLDTGFFFGYEDYDFCIRARKAGFRVVFVPSAKIWHKAAKARNQLPAYHETLRQVMAAHGIFGIKMRYRLFRKHARMPPFPVPLVSYFLIYWPMRAVQLLIFQRNVKSIVASIKNIMRELSHYFKMALGKNKRQ